nr:PIN domain-containing protein [Mesorhizobium sp. L-8-3]
MGCASFAVLSLVARRRLRPLVTTALFPEYEDVIRRPNHRLAHGLSDGELERLMSGFAALAEPVDVHYLWRPQLTDPKDEMVLEPAINGRAYALVTHNRWDFLTAAERFDVRVVTPAVLLERF